MDITATLPSPLHFTSQQPAPDTTQPNAKAPSGFAHPLSANTDLPSDMVTQRCIGLQRESLISHHCKKGKWVKTVSTLKSKPNVYKPAPQL